MPPNYTQNYNLPNTVICTIEGGNIIQVGGYGQPPKKIGITNEAEKEIKDLLEQYNNKLIELGVIKKPKTPEELQAETNNILLKLTERLDKMEEFINNGHKKIDTDSPAVHTAKVQGKN